MLVEAGALWGAEPVDVASLVRAINGVGPQGAGHQPAVAAWNRLAAADASQIPEILAGMDDAGRLSENWLRAAVETIAERHQDDGGQLPQAELEAFLLDRSHSPRARSLAYDLILRVDPAAKARLVPGLLNDPSMELRRDGVAFALDKAKDLLDEGKRAEARAAYRRTLTAARDLDQIDEAADQLRELGEAVDLPSHFGFLIHWKLVGPFDNKDTRGFDVPYGPESDPDPAAEYAGQAGPVTWFDHTTDDPYGVVDLNTAMRRHKGAITYARAVFVSDRDCDVEFRLGCINGNKLWVNGQLLFENHVYHTGTYIDQYNAQGRLRKGENVILLKIAQNEQTESWAQRWQFQLRVCDSYGTAILSQDRRAAPGGD
jgi:hypothetical protein